MFIRLMPRDLRQRRVEMLFGFVAAERVSGVDKAASLVRDRLLFGALHFINSTGSIRFSAFRWKT